MSGPVHPAAWLLLWMAVVPLLASIGLLLYVKTPSGDAQYWAVSALAGKMHAACFALGVAAVAVALIA